FGLEVARDEHGFAPVRSPWTLTRNDEAWRPQPLVAEGNLWTLAADLVLDDRNDPADPTDGWWVRARALRGLGGSLELPEHAVPGASDAPTPARPVDADFTTGTLDARRYARLGPDSDLAFRLFLGGSLDGKPLPPQFQHALGGEGTLPAYPLLSVDC